jgi:hypothetical protein
MDRRILRPSGDFLGGVGALWPNRVVRMRRRWSLPILLAACAAAPKPGDRLERSGDEIVICGQLFHTGSRVVLWMDPGGYDAYRPHRHFDPEKALPRDSDDIARYHSFRRDLPAGLDARVKRQSCTTCAALVRTSCSTPTERSTRPWT